MDSVTYKIVENDTWKSFIQKEALTRSQTNQFAQYAELLLTWNTYFNLTAITTQDAIVYDHFHDSLFLNKYINLHSLNGLVDVGSGGGFPGIPLAITNSHLTVVLIEVNTKKRSFLETVINSLHLTNVTISALDWRTFIRKTQYPIDIVCARASLRPDELIRQFMPDSQYQDASIVYWASENWQPTADIACYSLEEYPYSNNNKKRRLIHIKNNERNIQ